MTTKGPNTIKEIKQTTPGGQVWGKYLVMEKQGKKTKDGKDMYQLRVADATGEIDIVVWENCEIGGSFEKGTIVGILGDLKNFNNRLQINARRIKELPEENIDEYLKTPEIGIDILIKEFEEIITSIEDKYLKALLDEIFTPEIKEVFYKATAAKKVHHNYRGGLLEHSVSVAKICHTITGLYPDLNRDLLLTGAVLHDLAKIFEYEQSITPDYSVEGRLIGHIVMGSEFISKKINNLRQQEIDFPEKLELMIKHLILSHHGTLEFGSPIIPLFPEAFVLSVVDNMDAKLYVFFDKINNNEGDDELFTPYDNFFGQQFFKYRYPQDNN